MTPAPLDAPERHRAPALWLVVVGLVAATVTGADQGARAGATVLVVVLVAAAVARLIGGGRRPEGIAVRTMWFDVAVLLGLAASIGTLMLTPGVVP